MAFAWFGYDGLKVLAWFSYGFIRFDMVQVCFLYGFGMVWARFLHGFWHDFGMVLAWCGYVFCLVRVWFGHGSDMLLLKVVGMVLSWLVHGLMMSISIQINDSYRLSKQIRQGGQKHVKRMYRSSFFKKKIADLTWSDLTWAKIWSYLGKLILLGQKLILMILLGQKTDLTC